MLEKFLVSNGAGNWNTIPPVSEKQKNDINCHKFVLYALGRISFDELVSDSKVQREAGEDFTFGKKALEISLAPFELASSLQSVKELAQKTCKIGFIYVGQILDAKTGELAHSFLLERSDDGNLRCADKTGFKYPFNISKLETIFDFVNKDGEKSYHGQMWRFVEIKNFSK